MSIQPRVRQKPHFVLTTNVDHQFWKAGFADEDIFATQGDYGATSILWRMNTGTKRQEDMPHF